MHLPLWEFPPEIRRLIYLKLSVCDLKIFSACSSRCYAEVCGFLPDTAEIKISWISLLDLDTSPLDLTVGSMNPPVYCSGSQFLCCCSGNPNKFLHFQPYLTPEISWSNHKNVHATSSLFRSTRKVTSIEIRHFDPDFSFLKEEDRDNLDDLAEDIHQDDEDNHADFVYEDPQGTERFDDLGYDSQRIVKNFKNIVKLFDPLMVDTLRLRHFVTGTNEVFHIACTTFPNVQVLQLQRITYRDCQLVCHFKNLTDLNLNSSDLDDLCLTLICSKLSKLTKLDIGSNGEITLDGMAHIGKLEDLEELFMSDLGLELHEFNEVSVLTKLRKLDMNYCIETDMDLAVSKLTKLRHLDELCLRKSFVVKYESLWNAFAFGDDGVPYLCPYSLGTLDLRSCNLTDDGLKKLVAYQVNLRLLNISDTQVSDISPVIKLLRLVKLDISCLPVDDTDVRTLKHLPSLENLDLSITSAFDTLPPPLHEFQRLTSVKCCHDEINDFNVLALSRIVNLRKIDVSYSVNVTDFSLKYLGECVSLEKIAVAKTSITDIGLSYLTSLNMRSLNIALNPQLTDDCLEHLRAFKRLKKLRCYMTKMSKSAVQKFHRGRPWIQIVGDEAET